MEGHCGHLQLKPQGAIRRHASLGEDPGARAGGAVTIGVLVLHSALALRGQRRAAG